MSRILLIVGSVFGAAHRLADDVTDALTEHGHDVERNESPLASDLESESIDWLLVITSTTGTGELPEELVPMYNTLRDVPPRIAGLNYVVVVLGDSSYGDSFCGGGTMLDEALADIGAVRIADPFRVDAMEVDEPESVVLPWLSELPVLKPAPD